jgi:chromosome segregation ATPase
MADIGVSASALEALERDFEDVIRDLGGEDNLERFRLEYEKLHRALKKSHESERKLVKKCQELSQEIMTNAAKVQSAIHLSQEDQNTIDSLKKEIEKAWKMVDGAHEKESRAKETIQQLKKEAATLSALVEKGASLTHGQELSLADLTEAKRDLVRERDVLSTKINHQLSEIRDLSEKQTRFDDDITTRDEGLRRITAKLSDLRRDFDREVKSKDRADGQVKELQLVLQTRNNEADSRGKLLKDKTETIERLDVAIFEEGARKQDHAVKFENTQRQLEENKKSKDDFMETAAKCTEQISRLETEIKKREEDIMQVRYEEQKTQKAKDTRVKQIKKVGQDKDDIRKDHDFIQRQIFGLEKQKAILLKEAVVHEDGMQVVLRDTHVVEARSRKEQDKQQQIKTEIGSVVNNRKSLEELLEAQKKSNADDRATVVKLETERERFAELASEATVKFHEALEEVKIGKMRCDDLHKQIEEAGKQLVAQQGKYEQVRSDRNLYSKNLIEAQDEISEMKQKFKIMDHQIDQLKEELSMKERKHFEAVTNHKTLSERLSKLRKRINTLMEHYEDAKSRSESLSQEIKQLTKVINGCDVDLSQQQQHFLTVTNERDILGTQLIRRNDELALLYEKIRIQQSTLSKGEVQYRDRLVDIRMLRLKTSELKRNVHMAQVRVKNIDELKLQINTLTRQLALERTKVQALSEELENPQNFLRWRKLEGSDLKPVEKVQRIQALQKRLINVTEQCVEKDILVSEKDKLYVELKTILGRQPGPEVAEQLNIYQQDLRHRNTQMKCLASELNMGASQSSEFKYEIERLNRELQEVKKQYFEMKMNNQLLQRDRTQ